MPWITSRARCASASWPTPGAPSPKAGSMPLSLAATPSRFCRPIQFAIYQLQTALSSCYRLFRLPSAVCDAHRPSRAFRHASLESEAVMYPRPRPMLNHARVLRCVNCGSRASCPSGLWSGPRHGARWMTSNLTSYMRSEYRTKRSWSSRSCIADLSPFSCQSGATTSPCMRRQAPPTGISLVGFCAKRLGCIVIARETLCLLASWGTAAQAW